MQLLMFSGNSLRNQDWIIEAETKLNCLVDRTYVHKYDHWTSGAQFINLPAELAKLKKETPSFNVKYGVFAKSIGTVFAAQAIEQGIIKPKFLLFCGLPLDFIVKEYPTFAKVIAAYNCPTVVVHNENDKVGSADMVQIYMEPCKYMTNFQFITTPGNTHNYLDYELLKQKLQELVTTAHDAPNI